MYRKQILIGFAVIAAVWLLHSPQAVGQTINGNSNPSLTERLDQFGQSLKTGIFGRKTKPTNAQASQEPSIAESRSTRAGSAINTPDELPVSQTPAASPEKKRSFPPTLQELLTGERRAQTPSRRMSPASPIVPGYTQSPTLARSRPEATPADASQQAVVAVREQSPLTAVPKTTEPPRTRLAARPDVATPAPAGAKETTAPSTSTGPASQLLHERLQHFRTSVFGDTTSGASATTSAPTQAARQPSVTTPMATSTATAPERRTAKNVPTRAPRRAAEPPVPHVAQQPTRTQAHAAGLQQPTRAPARTIDPSTDGVLLDNGPAEQTDEAVTTEPESVLEPSPSEPDDSKSTAKAEPPIVELPGAEVAAEPHTPLVVAGDDRREEWAGQVLLTRRSPILNVKTLGPPRIAVGKQASFEVLVENLGEVAAEAVVVTMVLPEWADVVGAEGSVGAILAEQEPSGGKQLLWRVGPMEAKSRQKATLGIIPRQSRPIDLAVRWGFTPIASQAVIEVEEPKLAMRLEGPSEVHFGEPQVFQLEISNSGNGSADDVILTMMPLVAGEGGPTQHRLGSLAAGAHKTIDMELTARHPGALVVQMELRCDGPGRASLNETLLVRKANVEMKIDAPQMQFTGTVATYRIRVRNTGNLAADDIELTAKIPPEAKFVSAGQKGKASVDGQSVQWKLDRLPEGAEQELVLTCELAREGYSQLKVEAAGARVAAEAMAVTRVESIADLALEVTDPSGPVPLGQHADYTVRIYNRGSKDADGVEAVVYFSQGIEPVSAEGGRYTIRPGQILFNSLGVVKAGKEVVLKIKAKAEMPGNHMFRAEVYCRPLGTKLVGEETTHFYRAVFGGPETQLARPTPKPAPMKANPIETADRRNEPLPTDAPTSSEPSPSLPQTY
ncbi:MAG: hypothetical protein JW888_03275 [Pirellulales bacterium]|nr:hypothetical protein [Pirellulales bacterium]